MNSRINAIIYRIRQENGEDRKKARAILRDDKYDGLVDIIRGEQSRGIDKSKNRRRLR